MQALHLFDAPIRKPFNVFLLFCIPIFFFFVADNTLSYIFPILVEKSTNSNTVLGVIMALSSIAGILCDFTFPQLFANRSWRFHLISGVIIAFLFPILTYLGFVGTIIIFFILGTIIWGIYYEFINFAEQSFIVDKTKRDEYSKDWGILFLVYQIACIIGPILGSILLKYNHETWPVTIFIVQLLALGFSFVLSVRLVEKRIKNKVIEVNIVEKKEYFNLLKEVKYWKVLGTHIWPAILTGVTISLINATFWTIAGLFGEEIVPGNDWIVMILFSLPMILGSIVLAKLRIQKRKKRISAASLFLSGIILSLVFFLRSSTVMVLIVITASSFVLSWAGPLNDAVYSDLLDRLGHSRMHLLGLAKANASLAYIIAPLISGFISDRYGYYFTFTAIGIVAITSAVVLILFTPRKLRLPQHELEVMEGNLKV